MGTSRSFSCDPTLSVDHILDAANICDKETWMERLELVEQGLSKLRAKLWLTVDKCSVACEWNRATQHKRCGPRMRVDVVRTQTTSKLLLEFLLTSCL